ncbi:hypothetical protein K438DRAFT_2056238 [Mycena galopus ATCC 62051]|nr:hypothetical protein K438DRAFT_2056238 [Mycena galopus ATCC 62051]
MGERRGPGAVQAKRMTRWVLAATKMRQFATASAGAGADARGREEQAVEPRGWRRSGRGRMKTVPARYGLHRARRTGILPTLEVGKQLALLLVGEEPQSLGGYQWGATVVTPAQITAQYLVPWGKVEVADPRASNTKLEEEVMPYIREQVAGFEFVFVSLS